MRNSESLVTATLKAGPTATAMITFDALQIIFSLFVLHSHSHPPTHLNKHPTKFCNFIQQERGNLSKKQKKR